MNPARWRKVDDLFHAAMKLTPDERSAFLNRTIGDDSALMSEVRSLLRAGEQVGDFLDAPALGGVSRIIESNSDQELNVDRTGQRIGPYRLVKEIASGGMGTVYLAQRADKQYEQRVAIKLIRFTKVPDGSPYAGTLLDRFRRERQVLANFKHPYIARLLDGGETDDGLPYFVMEYVEGQPIDVFCESIPQQSGLLRECLELFCRVCEAVQYAHQNLVIHRDLKPGNILITNDGTPKLLDFGLAKILDPHHGMTTTTATIGGEIMGTFAYAAPEQVSGTGGSGGEQDTRCDVYALGMILYKLLTRRHAYPVDGTLSDILQNITETRPVSPSTVARGLDKDLDTIVLKAISKDRENRYPSAGALRRDIRLYLAGEPIMARSDSRWYVLKKTTRRYRVPLLVAAGFVLLITAFAINTVVQSACIAEHAASLDAALRESNIERGRVLGMMGNHVLGEELLWREYLRDRRELSTPTASPFSGDSRLLHSHWALWEHYAREPCFATYPTNFSFPLDMIRLPGGSWLSAGISGKRPALRRIPEGTVTILRDAPAVEYQLLRISPRGNFFATSDKSGQLLLWNLQSGSPPLTVATSVESITHLEFSPDERLLFGAAQSEMLCWESATGHSLPSAIELPVGCTRFHLSPDGRWALFQSISQQKTVLWDIQNHSPFMVIPASLVFLATSAFSPDSAYFATMVDKRTLHVYALPTGDLVTVISGLKDHLYSLDFPPAFDGRRTLAASSHGKKLLIWALPSGRLIRSFAQSYTRNFEITFTPDGSVVASQYLDFTKLWDTRSLGCLTRLTGHTDNLFAVASSPDGRIFASGATLNDEGIRLWDSTDNTLLRTLEGSQKFVSDLTFSPAGNLLASAGYDSTILLWNLQNDEPPRVLRGHRNNIFAVDFSPDGRWLASVGDDGEICIWNVADAVLEMELKQDTHRVPSVAWSPDGESLITTGDRESTVFIWNWREKTSRRFPGHDITTRVVRYSPRGDLFATAGDDQVIALRSPEGKIIASLTGHSHDIFALAFHPSSQLLASGDRGGVIKLWDIDAHRLLATLDEEKNEMIFSLAFTASGNKLVVASQTRTLGVWDLTYYDRHIAGNLPYWRQQVAEISRPSHRP